MKKAPKNVLKALVTVSLLVGYAASGQEWTINYPDIELADFIDEVANITQRSFVVDSRVRGTATIISDQQLDAEGVYTLLESVLRVHGYTIVDDGKIARVIPNAGAKNWYYEEGEGTFETGDKFIARVVGLDHITSAEASRVLRQLVSQYGHLAPVTDPNALVISDHSGNVERILKLLEELDQVEPVATLVLPMKEAWVREVANMLEELLPEMMRSEAGATPVGLLAFANENNNTLFLRGTPEELAIASEIVEQLDQPYSVFSTTEVFYLQHSEAVAVAEVLTGLLNLEGAPAAGAPTTSDSPTTVSVQADESNNAILARGTPSLLSDISSIINQLDRPKLQVLIESAIVEVSVTDIGASGVELGGTDESGERTPLATTSINGILAGLLSSLTTAQDASGSASPGTAALSQLASPTLAVAKLDPNGISFGAIINALMTTTKADLLSTPYVYAIDNVESSIFEGQQVPFRTGTFGVEREQGQTPLSTIERQDVGVQLTVTPNIREDLSVRMAILIEVDAVIAPSLGIGEGGFSDVVTSRREVSTTVVANNRQTIVLGGLIRDDVNQTVRRVPVLGSVPLLGRLFRSNSSTETKSHLLLFLRPTVIDANSDPDGANKTLAEIANKRLGGIWQLKFSGQRGDVELPTPEEVLEGGF